MHLDDGFDFLGFNVRRYRGKLLIKPSKAAIKRIRRQAGRRDARPARLERGGGPRQDRPDHARMGHLLPGRGVQRGFTALDDYMWKLTYKWASYSHENKPKSWIINRYYGRFNPARQDRWVFGDRDSGAYLPKFAWTKIVRHYMVPGTASPDDPALAEYWADRRRRNKPPLDTPPCACCRAERPLPAVRGLPPARRPRAAQPTRMGTMATGTRKAITRQNLTAHGRPGAPDDIRLVHSPAIAEQPARSRDPATSAHLKRPWGLLEPYAATSGTYGSEGAAAQQCAAATRQSAETVLGVLRERGRRTRHGPRSSHWRAG